MPVLLKPATTLGRILSKGKFICQHISTTNQKMDKITDMELETVSSSRWLQPRRLKYKQDGVAKSWDMLQSNGSVVSVVYNESSDSLVMVKQFRPAVLICKALRDSQGSQLSDINDKLKQMDVKDGITLELCAGIIDKAKTPREIARMEILEECGYDVPLEQVEEVQNVLGSVGKSGGTLFMHYARVNDKMKTGLGGGLAEEGEMIEVVEVPVSEVKEMIKEPSLNSPTFTLYGIYWFLMNKYNK